MLPVPGRRMRWARRSSNWTSFSSPWARAWDGHEVVDLAVGRLTHSCRPRALVADHQRVGNQSPAGRGALLAPAGLAHKLSGATGGRGNSIGASVLPTSALTRGTRIGA